MDGAGESKCDRNVFLPVDGSEFSKRAFKWYLDQVAKPSDHVFLMNIIEPAYDTPAMGMSIYSSTPLPEMNAANEKAMITGRALVDNFCDRIKEKKIKCTPFLQIDGKPGHAIVKCAEEHGANLIIIGSRGLGTMRRTFLGSVSDFVVHHVHVPVIVVPPCSKN